MNQICANCNTQFLTTNSDLGFYKKISPSFNGHTFDVPPPKLCPDCRQQRRIVWRNERSLYNRECSKTGKKIIAMYPPDSLFPVYDNDVWWSDQFDARGYGRDFDFSKSFFEQLSSLRDQVPHFALAVAKPTMENSDYCNHAGYLKNCYLIYNVDYDEQCMYGKGMNRCFDCLDCFKLYDSEACYECLNCYNCKFCTYLWDSLNCSECHFSYNLIGCKNCFLCVNLQNKEYFIKNEKYSSEEWKKKVESLKNEFSNERLLQKLSQAKAYFPVKRINENNTENCNGDYLKNCKNCEACFDCEYLENSSYCYDLKKGDGVSYENHDISGFGVGVVRCYEGVSMGYNSNHCLFCENVWDCFDCYYSLMCVNNCKNCFGCVGMRKAHYCILNKQYTKEEYEKMVARIIEHMIKDQQWGKFFPIQMSPFSYNETMAQEYYPMSSEEVLEKEYLPQKIVVPDKIGEVDESICEEILACKKSGRNFKIQKAELAFYKKMGLPIPQYCPDERHYARLKFRNPRKLYLRKCEKCKMDIKTTFAPDRPEKIYCENCYREEVFR